MFYVTLETLKMIFDVKFVFGVYTKITKKVVQDQQHLFIDSKKKVDILSRID